MPWRASNRCWAVPWCLWKGLLLAACFGLISLRENAEAQEVKILASTWLSTDGVSNNREEFFSTMAIIPIAIKHFNERTSSVIEDLPDMLKHCNTTLHLSGRLRDTQGTSSIAMNSLMKDLDETGVDSIILTRSEVAQTMAMTAGALNIPVISATATAAILSDKGTYPTFFRTVFSDAQSASYLASLIARFKYTTVGLVHGNDAFGTGLRVSLTSALAEKRIRLVSASMRNTGPFDEITQSAILALNALKSEKIQVIIKGTLLLSQELALARAAKQIDWLKGKLYIGRRTLTREVLDLAKGDPIFHEFLAGSINVVSSFDRSGIRNGHLFESISRADTEVVNAAFVDPKFYIPEDYFFTLSENSMSLASSMYDGIMALGISACRARSNIFTEEMRQIDFMGASGRFSFNSAQDRAIFGTIYMQVENWLPVGDNGLESINVAETVNGTWSKLKDIVMNDGSTTLPADVVRPYIHKDSIPLGARIAGWIESAIGLLLCVLTLISLMKRRREKVIKLNQPGLMVALVFGAALLAASILPLTFETDAACMAFPWMFVLGFCTASVGLALKSLPYSVSSDTQMGLWKLLFAILFLSAIAGMIAAQVLEPLSQVEIVHQQDTDGFPLAIGLVCSSPTMNSLIAVICVVSMLAFISLVLGLCTQRSKDPMYRTSVTKGIISSHGGVASSNGGNVSSNGPGSCEDGANASHNNHERLAIQQQGSQQAHSESGASDAQSIAQRRQVLAEEAKHLTLASICIFQVFFVGIPTSAAVWQIALSRFLVLSSVTWVLCLVVLGTMFAPKLLFKLVVVPSNGNVQRNMQMSSNNVPEVDSGTRNTSPRATSANDIMQTKPSSELSEKATRIDGSSPASVKMQAPTPGPILVRAGKSTKFLDNPSQQPKMLPSFVNLEQLQALSTTATPPPVPVSVSGHAFALGSANNGHIPFSHDFSDVEVREGDDNAIPDEGLSNNFRLDRQ